MVSTGIRARAGTARRLLASATALCCRHGSSPAAGGHAQRAANAVHRTRVQPQLASAMLAPTPQTCRRRISRSAELVPGLFGEPAESCNHGTSTHALTRLAARQRALRVIAAHAAGARRRRRRAARALASQRLPQGAPVSCLHPAGAATIYTYPLTWQKVS